MDIAVRLESIEQEIQQVENQKLDFEQMWGLFWEHMPAGIDPALIQKNMRYLRDPICALESRKRDLLEERQALIVQAATLRDQENEMKK